MKYYHNELFPSYATAAIALQKALLDGWRIDMENPPDQVGFSYSLGLVRDYEFEPEPKLSRAEILVIARAARSKKYKEIRENENNA